MLGIFVFNLKFTDIRNSSFYIIRAGEDSKQAYNVSY
jgi:hypothetical protein